MHVGKNFSGERVVFRVFSLANLGQDFRQEGDGSLERGRSDEMRLGLETTDVDVGCANEHVLPDRQVQDFHQVQ